MVAGGRPKAGPMQAVSGSRGAAAYSADGLDYDIEQVNATLHDAAVFSALPNRSDTGVWTTYAGFTIRNQVRENDPTPLQFKYQAADCRIYYTLANVYNMTQLWHDAARAAWKDESLCVEGSTGYPTARNQTSSKTPPTQTAQAHNLNFDDIPNIEHEHNATFEIQSGPEEIIRSIFDFELCDPKTEGKTGNVRCLPMNVTCSGANKRSELWQMNVLRGSCHVSKANDNCRGTDVKCKPSTRSETKGQAQATDNDSGSALFGVRYDGYCATNRGTADLCKANQRTAHWCRSTVNQKTTWAKC